MNENKRADPKWEKLFNTPLNTVFNKPGLNLALRFDRNWLTGSQEVNRVGVDYLIVDHGWIPVVCHLSYHIQ